ncbi:hypothetical protein BJ741DRAFT_621037 [Chytriomyces cf. hyalinus JEL632]|nr:hypothetical protein BJ741DRAFT_621037 [Chytriomyces cf. hyalinus JEL632]
MPTNFFLFGRHAALQNLKCSDSKLKELRVGRVFSLQLRWYKNGSKNLRSTNHQNPNLHKQPKMDSQASNNNNLSVKVQYAESLRQILLSPVEQESWHAFVARIRAAFQISETEAIAVSYLDDDKDVITLDSDQELSELLKYRDASKPIKFTVTETKSANRSSQDKGKSPETPKKNVFEELKEKLDPMMTDLKDEFEKSNIGPLLEKISKQAQAHFEEAFTDSDRNGSTSSRQPRPGHPHPYAFSGHRMYGCHPMNAFVHQKAAPRASYPPRWEGVVCDGCNSKSFTGDRFKCKTCEDFDLCGTCHVTAKDIHNAQHEFEEVKHAWFAAEDEQIAMLAEMGFVEDEAKARELLRRYDNSANRVAEVLLHYATKQTTS